MKIIRYEIEVVTDLAHNWKTTIEEYWCEGICWNFANELSCFRSDKPRKGAKNKKTIEINNKTWDKWVAMWRIVHNIVVDKETINKLYDDLDLDKYEREKRKKSWKEIVDNPNSLMKDTRVSEIVIIKSKKYQKASKKDLAKAWNYNP